MRRTTICRSERASPARPCSRAARGVAPAVAAQDTTQARPDTSTAPAPVRLKPRRRRWGQLPATHTVTTGETLWSIAQLYYNDPPSLA